MYSISLLPYEYRMLNSKARKKSISLLIAIGVMGILFAAYLILTVFASGKVSELRGIRAESLSVDAQIASMGEIKIINDEVGLLIVDVMLAADTNPDWNRLIADIGNSVPDSLSFKNVKMDYENSSGECVIQGIGLGHNSVIDWINNLEDITGISDIKCKYSSKADDNINTVEFELSFMILKGSGYKIPLGVIDNE